MPELSRKWLREGIEQIVTKGAARIGAEELDLTRLIQNIAKGARSTTHTGRGRVETPVRARDLGEAILSVVRSIDSFADLQSRVHEHKGEFVNATQHFSRDLYVAFQHLAAAGKSSSPASSPQPLSTPRPEIGARSLEGKDDATTNPQAHRSQDSDT